MPLVDQPTATEHQDSANSKRTIVIGGGVIGTTTTFWLARAGYAVTLLERQNELAAEGSFANGAMLHASHGEPWNSPQAVRQLLTWLGREHSPLLLRPQRLPHLLSWGLRFLRNSTAARHRAATFANTRLARYSLDAMSTILSEAAIDDDGAQDGIVKLFWKQADLEAAQRWSEELQALGVPWQRWSREQLLDQEPALAGCASKLVGALYYPQDASGDTCRFTRQLGQHCAALGAELRTSVNVLGLALSGGRVQAVVTDQGRFQAEQVILANGAEAARLARSAGLRLPIEPVKGYSITIDTQGIGGLPRLPLIDDHHKIVATPLGSRLRLAGTAEFAGYDTSLNPRRLALLLNQLRQLLPLHSDHLAAAPRTEWACLRPMTPDGAPIIGPTAVQNLWLNTGAGHMGWTIAAGAGRLLTAMLQGQQPELPIADYALARWA